MEALERAFEIFDLNHDGLINLREIDKFLNDILSLHNAHASVDGADDADDAEGTSLAPAQEMKFAISHADAGLWNSMKRTLSGSGGQLLEASVTSAEACSSSHELTFNEFVVIFTEDRLGEDDSEEDEI